MPNSVRLVSISAEPRLAQNLNAPFGAQCFPTREEAQGAGLENLSQCTFWCPALSDLSSVPDGWSKDRIVSQCTFWCSVLSDMEDRFAGYWKFLDGSQCTFWCSVPSDLDSANLEGDRRLRLNAPSGAQCFPTLTAMHLTNISLWSQCTFWCSVLSDGHEGFDFGWADSCLNAPSGAQCFPTIKLLNFSSTNGLRLNAPSGAQCFPTGFCEYVCVD